MLTTFLGIVAALVSAPHVGSASTSTSAYTERIEDLAARRRALATAYRRATDSGRSRILALARREVLNTITAELAPAWYGTPWRYSGRTDRPRDDAIACGTFVATLLRDAGFRLNRIALGRLASEHIAQSLTAKAHIRRYRNRPGDEVAADVEHWGEGLYVLGLDYHAALVHVDDRGHSSVIHSSYYEGRVLAEPLRTELGFRLSRYRVVAKLLTDPMMRKWLKGETFKPWGR